MNPAAARLTPVPAVRLEGWERRLEAVIEDARQRPYRLGEHDCFRLTCRVLEALTGRDRWPEFSGYTTRREGLAGLARHGRSFEAAFDWFFGAPSVDVRQARRGDLCCVQTVDGEKHMGVCLGAEVALLAPEGLTYTPTLTCRCAWRVG
jgi:hypothetical protein